MLRTLAIGAAALLLDEGCAFVTAAVPDIGDGDELEVELLGMFLEGRYQRAFGTVTWTDQSRRVLGRWLR